MKKAIHTERGGIRAGDHEGWLNLSIAATWPNAKLILTSDYLEISYSRKKCFRFKKEDIHSIEFYSSSLYQGILFSHSKKEVPKFLVFWSFRRKKLLNILRENGWSVK